MAIPVTAVHKGTSKPATPKIIAALMLLLFLPYNTIFAQTQKEDIEKYFSDIKETFDYVAAAPAVKGTNLPRTDRYFVSVLKKHQPFYSLIKTNSKGVIISEIVRGQTPERNFRVISDQPWFPALSKKFEDYAGLLKEDNGRYYLFWCKPVVKGNKHFIGAVAAKIDLWDCIHKYSSNVAEPFLVRLGNKSLYSHKWKTTDLYEQVALDIPGISKIYVRFPKGVPQDAAVDSSAIAATPDTVVKTAIVTEPVVEKAKTEKSPAKKNNTFRTIILVIMGIALIVLIFYMNKLYIFFKEWRLRRKIDNEENIFK